MATTRLDVFADHRYLDAHYPGWNAQPDPTPYDDVAHQAFKHRYRSEIATMKRENPTCQGCGASAVLVADPAPDWTLRGVVCRKCRFKLKTHSVEWVLNWAEFTRDYCRLICQDNPGSICDKHSAEMFTNKRLADYLRARVQHPAA